MKSITANLARSQLKNNRKRTVVTIIGIALSVAMITAVFGFSASGINTMRNLAGEENLSNYRPVLVSLSAVLGTIIILSSIVVISNAFRISASERMRQFGILKSVGATKRQILKIVLQEGLFLSLVAIPAGMIAGLLVEWLGTSIGDALLAPMNKLLNTGLSIHMQFVLSWESLLLALCLSFATVMVSAYIPARKAARIPAIDAIRLTQEVKPTGRKPRAHKLVRLLFGFEGTLAAKSIRRSRRSYRAMVVALTISVVLFLICGSLDAQLAMAVNQTYANIDATSILTFSVNQSDSGPLDADSMQALTDKLKEYPDTQLYGVGIDGTHTIRISETALTDTMLSSYEPGQTEDGIILLAPDPEHYAELCQLAGVPVGSNILLNSTQLVINEKQTEFQPVRFSGQTLTVYHNGTATALPLDAQLTGTQVPQELLFVSEAALIVVVPDTEAYMYVWLGNSLDTTGFTEYAETVMYDFRQTYTSFSVTDITAVTDMTRSLTKLITIFLYGFVAMLSLIGLTSVIAAISANVRLRAREFAVLQSVGMTTSGVRRMLALESIMSAFKALLYGLPLGTLAMYLTYRSVTIKDTYQFIYPWLTAAEAVAAVFLIAVIATQYAAAKLRKGNIMDVIRASEGV